MNMSLLLNTVASITLVLLVSGVSSIGFIMLQNWKWLKHEKVLKTEGFMIMGIYSMISVFIAVLLVLFNCK